jgi:undecaprenyl-diphosphatase
MNNIYIFGAKYLFLASIIIAVYYFLKIEKKKEFFKFAIFSLPLSLAIAKIFNLIYFDPRPFVVNNFEPLIKHAVDNGFPSDHTLLAASLAALVTVFDCKIGGLLWLIALAVGISRVLVGVHHIIDIVGSIVISIISAAVVYYSIIKRQTDAARNKLEQE